MNGTTVIQSIQFRLETCYKCGIPFMFSTEKYWHLQKTGESFYCPNGHGQIYTKTTEQKLQDKLDAEKKRADEEINRLKRERNDWQDLWNKKCIENKKLTAKQKRDQKRIMAGVCPCCNRTFQNLARHMETKHKEGK